MDRLDNVFWLKDDEEEVSLTRCKNG